jgi:hypothetical protein
MHSDRVVCCYWTLDTGVSNYELPEVLNILALAQLHALPPHFTTAYMSAKSDQGPT